MAVVHRVIRSGHVAGVPALGAVRDGDHAVVAFGVEVKGSDLEELAGAEQISTRRYRAGAVRKCRAADAPFAGAAEPDVMAGRDVLLAVRTGERPEAAVDWLDWHMRQIGAGGAVIFDRAPPDEPGFAEALSALSLPDLPIVVVQAERPMGRPGLPDARDPATAPAQVETSAGPAPDRWYTAFGEPAFFELLRRRFLGAARAVACLDIADLVLPDPGGGPFRRARERPARFIPMQGVETYPWRLRRGLPAPHSDHIALRAGERRWLTSWAMALADLPEGCLWQPGLPVGVSADSAAPVAFRRAMGVVFPGTRVADLVDKSELVEDQALVSAMAAGFDAAPLRLPAPAAIPMAEASQRRVTVVTAMKNEGPFILDWIAHNRTIGVARHLVYTNDCADGTEELLDLLGEAGVTRRDNPYRRTGAVPQRAAFSAARHEEAVSDADWVLTLDVDEYINIHAGARRMVDLFEAVPDAHVVSMPWRLFGNGGLHGFEDRPVTAQFTRCAPEYSPRPLQAWGFKTLFCNAGLFRSLGVHRPKNVGPGRTGQIRWVDGAGRALPPTVWRGAWRMTKASWGYDLVTLNHYAVRSAESFLVKRERGRVNHVGRDQGPAYWFRMNLNADEDQSIRALDDAVAAEKARLLALPGVAEAHRAAVDWHRARIATLRATPEGAAFFAEITGSRMERLCRMQHHFGTAVFLAGPHVVPDEIVARDPDEEFFFTVEPGAGRAL